MNISTFSLVARDLKTGLIAVAGGTNWFNYGRWVPHIKAGFGALATQAETNMYYAQEGIQALQEGSLAEQVIDLMLKKDPDTKGVYQLLVIDNYGNTDCYTGENCHNYAGSICEENLAVAGNTLVDEQTLKAVINSYKTSKLSFPHKIIKALQEGRKAGGDLRGMKSASLKIAKGEGSGKYWNDIIYDLRVDEHTDPLKELERIYYVAEAYQLIDRAESELLVEDKIKYYQKALELDKNNGEILFWLARCYQSLNNFPKVEEIRSQLHSLSGHWDEYWKRLDN